MLHLHRTGILASPSLWIPLCCEPRFQSHAVSCCTVLWTSHSLERFLVFPNPHLQSQFRPSSRVLTVLARALQLSINSHFPFLSLLKFSLLNSLAPTECMKLFMCRIMASTLHWEFNLSFISHFCFSAYVFLYLLGVFLFFFLPFLFSSLAYYLIFFLCLESVWLSSWRQRLW